MLKKLSKKRSEAFTLVEMLIAMIIVAILGGVAVGALWLFFASFSQIDDLTRTEFELNIAAQRLSRDFAMIGLGMPNNSGREPIATDLPANIVNIGIVAAPEGRVFNSSFANSFSGLAVNDRPVTAFFGLNGSPELGGPVTITTGPVTNLATANANIAALANHAGAGGPNRLLFVGPELHYAFGVPTGVMARIGGGPLINSDSALTITPVANAFDDLRDFSWGGQPAGVQSVAEPGVTSANTRAWVLLPTLRIPLRVDNITAGSGNMQVTAAPDAPAIEERFLMTLDEIHVMQAARIFRDPATRELRRRVLSTPDADGHEVLARNIVGLQFAFDPQSRILTMFIAARGNERNPAVGLGQHNWPAWLPNLDNDDLEFRIVTKTLSWGMRN